MGGIGGNSSISDMGFSMGIITVWEHGGVFCFLGGCRLVWYFSLGRFYAS